MRKYETLLLLPPDAEDTVVQAVIDRISRILAERGGEVGKVDKWGRRRLAYPIDRNAEGYYTVVELTASPEALSEIDRVLSLADEVLRFKTVVRAA